MVVPRDAGDAGDESPPRAPDATRPAQTPEQPGPPAERFSVYTLHLSVRSRPLFPSPRVRAFWGGHRGVAELVNDLAASASFGLAAGVEGRPQKPHHDEPAEDDLDEGGGPAAGPRPRRAAGHLLTDAVDDRVVEQAAELLERGLEAEFALGDQREQILLEFKERLKVRFQQIDIWMTTFPIEVL
jgi:hypothetical protein